MNAFGERIKDLRSKHSLSQRALAKKLGVTNATISNWENGVTNPAKIQREVLDAAVAELRTSVAYLLDGKGPATSSPHPDTDPIREQDEEDDYDPETEVRLPVFDIEVSGGPGSQNPEFVETRETLTFRKSWLRKMRAAAEDIRIVTVRGSSMETTLYDGDKLALHTGRTKIRDGRVFAIAYNNEARVKRLHLLVDGRLRISSDNMDKTRFPDEFLEGEEINRVHIIGQAVHRMGEGGL